MFRALIFDMDGLMVDTEPLYWEVARQLARNCGTEVSDEALRKMMGRSRMESMRIFADACGIDSRTPEDLLVERETLMLERYGRGVEPMPGLREIIAQFRGRLRFAVATSSPRKFTDVLLPAMGIADEFEVVETGDEIEHGKPHPEIYLKCMSQMGVAGNECIVLEDSKAGATSGKRARATVIAVPSHLTAIEDFSDVADERVTNLFQAAEVIEELLTRS
jgi:HAD superfamily hydrolase (TIGR01509 family)